MKYREIVDLIKTICLDNYFINEFSYGNISDINTPDDEEPVNYPYAFLNPINITNDGITATFSANLIVMTQTYETLNEELTQQSNCINYLEQIISHINMNLNNPLVEFITPFTITPFKERFSDNVVGATASISIQYPANINDCESPYSDICDDYKTICVTGLTRTFADLNGKYTYYKNAYFDLEVQATNRIKCQKNIAFYTGLTVNNKVSWIGAYDSNGDGSTYTWYIGEINTGVIDCDALISSKRFTLGNLRGLNFVECEGILFPDVSLQPENVNFNSCESECDKYLNICATNTFPSNLAGTYNYYKNGVIKSVGGITFDIECGGNIPLYTGTTTDTNNPTILAAWDINGDGSRYQWQFGEVISGTLGCNERIDFTPTVLNVIDTISCLNVEYPDVSNDPPLKYGICQ